MLVKQRLSGLGHRGDTIIEVMIVLAVLGLAIGIAYTTAHKSLLLTRGAQENTRATQLLQSQIEKLRSLSSNKDPADHSKYIFQSGVTYCIVDSPGPPPTPVIVEPASTSPGCKPEGLYNISIRYCTGSGDIKCTGHTALNEDTFLLTAIWDSVQGDAQDTITMTYRLHQPL